MYCMIFFFFPAGAIECPVVVKRSCVIYDFLTTYVGGNALFSFKHHNKIHFACLTLKKTVGNSDTNLSASLPETHRNGAAAPTEQLPSPLCPCSFLLSWRVLAG